MACSSSCESSSAPAQCTVQTYDIHAQVQDAAAPHDAAARCGLEGCLRAHKAERCLHLEPAVLGPLLADLAGAAGVVQRQAADPHKQRAHRLQHLCIATSRVSSGSCLISSSGVLECTLAQP